jgi:uncharacterized membrane protein YobD (UPF0266 family)
MKNSNSAKTKLMRLLIGNPISKFVLSFIINPINFLYAGLGIFVVLITYVNTFSVKPAEQSFFSGKIIFGNEDYHRIQTNEVVGTLKSEMGENTLTITATNKENLESVYLKIFKLKGPGTYFIPGDGEIENIGNLIKNLDHFSDKNNFFESTLPNKEGVQNGVGRVNITLATEKEIEGELILIGNNSRGDQAVLESAKFKIHLQ